MNGTPLKKGVISLDKIIDCKTIAQKIKDEVKEKTKGKQYKLTVISNPEDIAGKTYIKNKKKCCEECGIDFEEIPLDINVDEDDLKRVLMEETNPMIVQLPMTKDLQGEALEEFLSMTSDPYRDADGFVKNAFVDPATPKGIMRIFDETKYNLEGKHVVVVGRSNIVGKPVADMCLKRNATVTICHSKTKNLKDITKQADVLIVACGQPKMITKQYIKSGAFVVDVGVHRIDGKLCGDVDTDSVISKVSKIAKSPGGCGLLTVACLMENVVELYEKKN